MNSIVEKAEERRLRVYHQEGEPLNGLGMMIFQYLKQNLAEFEDKVEAGTRIRGRVAVEVEKGIGITLDFAGDSIQVSNGVAPKPDLSIQSSYLLLSRILAGKANPFLEVFRGGIKLRSLPRKPVHALRVMRFLKIPSELLLEPVPSWRGKYIIWMLGILAGAGVLSYLFYHLYQFFTAQ